MKIKEFKTKLLSYIIDRSQEPSTWRGLTLAISAIGFGLSEDNKELIMIGGLLISGMIGALFPDQIKK
jgi:hypothetical protein